MAGLSLHLNAFVLERRPAASDGWAAYRLFGSEAGLVTAMRREKAGPAAGSAPYLFDEIAAVLESSNHGRSWFWRESRLLRRPEGIGRSYEALRGASQLARMVARNPVAAESRGEVHRLLGEAFTAFGQGLRPDLVLFKAVFRFARGEGHPVKEEWLAQLRPDEGAAAEDTLARPVRESAVVPEVVARWQRQLEDYLRGRPDLEIE